MSTATNVKAIGAYNNCFRFTVFGEQVSDDHGTFLKGQTRIFSIMASIPDKSLTINLANIKSPDKNTNSIFYCDGSFAQDTTGEAIVETMDFSLTLNQDYNTIINTLAPEVCKDIWRAILTGDKFTDGNDHEFVVVGVNGQRWVGTSSYQEKDTKYLLYRDGLLKHPSKKEADGTPALEPNGKASPFKDRALHLFEIMGKFSSNASEQSGYRIAYAMNASSSFNQDTTVNNYGIDEKRLCDVWDIDKYLVEGVSNAQLINAEPTDITDIYRIGRASNGVSTGKVYFTEGTAAVATCSGGGVAGDIVVAVNTTTGVVSVFKVTGATAMTAIDANYNLGVGCKIFSNYKITTNATAVALGTSTESHGYIAIKTAGATAEAIASDWDTSEAGTSTFKGLIMDWGYTTQKFTPYLGE
jgi:hypothetical protein